MKLLNSPFLTRSYTFRSLVMAILVFPFAVQAFDSEKQQSFSDVDRINVKTISGDLTLISSNSGEIEVTAFSTYGDNRMEMLMEQEGDHLTLKEKSHGSGSFSGQSKWTIAIPDSFEVDIKFNTASGDFKSNDISANLKINTASGDIKLKNYTGKVKGNTASGDVKLVNVSGSLKLNTASGDVKGELNRLTGNSKFSSASGDVELDMQGNLTLSHLLK